MKTTDKIDYRLKSKQQFSEEYSLVNYEIRIKPSQNQDFIVPWQMVETGKKEVFAE